MAFLRPLLLGGAWVGALAAVAQVERQEVGRDGILARGIISGIFSGSDWSYYIATIPETTTETIWSFVNPGIDVVQTTQATLTTHTATSTVATTMVPGSATSDINYPPEWVVRCTTMTDPSITVTSWVTGLSSTLSAPPTTYLLVSTEWVTLEPPLQVTATEYETTVLVSHTVAGIIPTETSIYRVSASTWTTTTVIVCMETVSPERAERNIETLSSILPGDGFFDLRKTKRAAPSENPTAGSPLSVCRNRNSNPTAESPPRSVSSAGLLGDPMIKRDAPENSAVTVTSAMLWTSTSTTWLVISSGTATISVTVCDNPTFTREHFATDVLVTTVTSTFLTVQARCTTTSMSDADGTTTSSPVYSTAAPAPTSGRDPCGYVNDETGETACHNDDLHTVPGIYTRTYWIDRFWASRETLIRTMTSSTTTCKPETTETVHNGVE